MGSNFVHINLNEMGSHWGFTFERTLYTPIIICTPFLLKTGTAPLQWWFPGVMEGLRWENTALLITVQKAAPLILVSYLIEINPFTLGIILISTIVGSIGGLNQNSIWKILTYSSINHTGWIWICERNWIPLSIIFSVPCSYLAWRWPVTFETCSQVLRYCNYCILFDVCYVLTVHNIYYTKKR